VPNVPDVPNAPSNETPSDAADAEVPAAGRLLVTFDYAKQSGHASNQFAVWLQSEEGDYLTTLYATAYIAKGGWKKRSGIPAWVEASGIKEMSADEIDAISSATPKAGTLTYTYSDPLKDASGNIYEGDKFRVVVEGSLRWENRVLYSCLIDKATGTVSEEDTQFVTKGTEDGEALGEGAEERGMLTRFHVEYAPAV
jgi:hypothetical protein